jgi:signal transduction histidine kinase
MGSFVLAFDRPRALGPEDRAFVLALAQKCGQALERARLFNEAQAAVRLRDEFLSVASHELRTPLTPLHLQLQILRREAQDPAMTLERLRERVKRAVEGSESQVRKLADLINDLLDVSRISAGRLQLELGPVDFAEVVRDVVARFEPQALKADCALTLEVPASLVGRWDRRRLEQVVTNLLTNALKYGAGRPVHLHLTSEEGRARLTVRDEGIGIAPQDQGRIFERFERAVSERHFGGMGLGLYICRQIVDALRGTIGVRSEPGQGATFQVVLPTAE